jgi:hypothetical protein
MSNTAATPPVAPAAPAAPVATPATPATNNKKNASTNKPKSNNENNNENENNNNSNTSLNSQINNLLKSFNNTTATTTGTTENKKNEGIIAKGINAVGNTISDIKNTILGNSNNSKKNTNTEKPKNENKANEKNNKDNTSMFAPIVAALPFVGKNNDKKNSVSSTANNKGGIMEQFEDESALSIIVKVIVAIIVLVLVFYLARYLINKYYNSVANAPYLLNGSKNGKHALVISQDPTSINYIPIKKSEDRDGIEFSYGFWILLDNFDYKKGEWKHVFHKGNSTAYPNRAPGVWIHPDTNSMRVYMNTLEEILEYGDIDNLPVRKWMYISIVVKNKVLDIYVNGFLKTRKELTALPKQNDDDFWISMYGGFEGYLSNIRYYSYAIDYNEMNDMIKSGPSVNNCIDTGEVPPYLDDNWWFKLDV